MMLPVETQGRVPWDLFVLRGAPVAMEWNHQHFLLLRLSMLHACCEQGSQMVESLLMAEMESEGRNAGLA